MHILVTGGAGYIGSHTCLELLQAGYSVTVVDSLANSKPEALLRVQALAGKSLVFHQIDLWQIQAGISRSCAISIPSARTQAAGSARTRTAYPIT